MPRARPRRRARPVSGRALRPQPGRLGRRRGREPERGRGLRRDERRPRREPGEQERWASRTNLARAGLSADELEEANAYVDQVLVWLRNGTPFDEVRSRVDAQAPPAAFERLGLPLLPDDAATWDLFARIVDYDPRPALERIRVPLLALFGAEDRVTPVEESVAVYQAAVRPEFLTVRVFAGGDHRVLAGDPPLLVDGYLEALSSFVEEAAAVTCV